MNPGVKPGRPYPIPDPEPLTGWDAVFEVVAGVVVLVTCFGAIFVWMVIGSAAR